MIASYGPYWSAKRISAPTVVEADRIITAGEFRFPPIGADLSYLPWD